ncbi:hypothetical protein, partial [Mycobacterium avium]|uniref:hypothetical protein n=1 Tax=Mycobacterium avium TaxID=1764 RepID=UPI001E4E05AC
MVHTPGSPDQAAPKARDAQPLGQFPLGPGVPAAVRGDVGLHALDPLPRVARHVRVLTDSTSGATHPFSLGPHPYSRSRNGSTRPPQHPARLVRVPADHRIT